MPLVPLPPSWPQVVAWLVINSMRSERIQFNQLCIQSVGNVWRKNAFRLLLDNYPKYCGGSRPEDTLLNASLEVFREPVGFNVSAKVPEPPMLTTMMQELQDKNSLMIRSDRDRQTIAEIKNRLIAAAKEQQIEEAKLTVCARVHAFVVVLCCVVLCCVVLCCVVLCCVALRCVALRCVALRCVALRCVALRCVALCCVVLCCVVLRCVVLCCVVLY